MAAGQCGAHLGEGKGRLSALIPSSNSNRFQPRKPLPGGNPRARSAEEGAWELRSLPDDDSSPSLSSGSDSASRASESSVASSSRSASSVRTASTTPVERGGAATEGMQTERGDAAAEAPPPFAFDTSDDALFDRGNVGFDVPLRPVAEADEMRRAPISAIMVSVILVLLTAIDGYCTTAYEMISRSLGTLMVLTLILVSAPMTRGQVQERALAYDVQEADGHVSSGGAGFEAYSIKVVKARFVGCGYSQVEQHDYDKVFAATLCAVAFRILICCIAVSNLETDHTDAVKAFIPPAHGQARLARLDITFAVNKLCARVSDPTATDYNQGLAIIGYLSTTRKLGITYGGSIRIPVGLKEMPQGLEESSGLYVVHDNSFGTCARSMGGFVVMYCNGAIDWSASNLKVVPDSSHEAESAQAARAAKAGIYARQLLVNNGRKVVGPTICFGDNKSNRTTSQQVGSSSRTRY